MNGQHAQQFDEPWQFVPDDPRINDVPYKNVNTEEVPF